MKFSAGLGALGLSFLLATGATAQQHPLIVNGTVDEIKQLMKDRFPEGTRIFTTIGTDADADDVSFSWELQTSKMDQLSSCAEGIGVVQLRILVLSDHDLEASDYGALHFTQRASEVFNAYMADNIISEVPMDDKPDEMTEEAWYHAYKMGEVADRVANETGITTTIFTVQIPTDQLPGIDVQCNVPMSPEMMEKFGITPPEGGPKDGEGNGSVIEPPDMGGNGGVITPKP